jgi:integrase/recombinase XerD
VFRGSRVSVSGPLAEFAEGFAAELAGVGYSPPSAEAQLRLMNHVSLWLVAQGLAVGDLGGGAAQAAFVAERRVRYTQRVIQNPVRRL